MKPIPPQPGSAQDIRHFVGRTHETTLARQKLLNGTNLLVNDPRRMGKTYWIRYFAATTADFVPVVVDYEGVYSREQFLVRTVEALRKAQLAPSILDKLRGLFDNIEIGSTGALPVTVKVGVQKQSSAKILRDTLATVAEQSTQPILICMDEVPLAILNIAAAEGSGCAREMLQALRELRQAESRIRWIMSGSVGFHHVLAKCGTTAGDINDLDNLLIGPLSDTEAEELAKRLLAGIGRPPSEGAVQRLVERSGSIPFLLHKIAALLQNRDTGTVTVAEIDEVFEDLIDDPDEFRQFGHLLDRVEVNYGDKSATARSILNLTATARENDWVDSTDIKSAFNKRLRPDFDAVLDDLISDHYLQQRGRRIRWRYPVFQYIWARRARLVERP